MHSLFYYAREQLKQHMFSVKTTDTCEFLLRKQTAYSILPIAHEIAFFPYAQFPLINPKQDVQPHSHQYSNRSAIITQNKGAILKKVWKMIRKSSWIDTRFISWNTDASNNQTGFFLSPNLHNPPCYFSLLYFVMKLQNGTRSNWTRNFRVLKGNRFSWWQLIQGRFLY